MSKPTFIVTQDLVRIDVRGIPHPKGHPHLPDDQGIVPDLMKAMLDGALPYDVFRSSMGGGVYIGYWRRRDAYKIVAWLDSRATPVEEHPRK